MTPLEIFENMKLDINILSLSSQNHLRRKYVREHIMTEKLIRYCMETLGYTANHICINIFHKRGYYTDAGTIIDFCKEKNIKTYSIQETANNPMVRKKYELTCVKKYGSINALSRNTSAYKKRNKTIKIKYDVENVFQLENIKEKSKQTMMDKYGVSSSIFLPSFERNYGRKSKIHKKIEKILTDNNVVFESEAKNKFSAYNENMGKEYSPIVDILIETKKTVIEINGDMWHANPKFYCATDMIYKWGGFISASDIWKLDKYRNNQIKQFGYTVVVLWQHDINKNITHVNKILNEKIFKN